jgi:gelsolin
MNTNPDNIKLNGTVQKERELEIQKRINASKSDEQWKDAGKKSGIQVWRIEDFGVKKWDQVGTFYDGDSFIVLHTYGNDEKHLLSWDIHFWIGSASSIDEQGTAALKTIELDSILGGMTTQYREVQGKESAKFLSYFENFSVLPMGINSSFKQAQTKVFTCKLLQVKGRANTMRVREIPLKAPEMNHGDCYVLDADTEIYVIEGAKANPLEKLKASKMALGIESTRVGKAKVFTVDHESDQIWKYIEGSIEDVKSVESGGLDTQKVQQNTNAVLYRLSDNSGSLELNKVDEGKAFFRNKLDTNDVFIADNGAVDDTLMIFVWVGKQASLQEKHTSMRYAMDYANRVNRQDAPVVKINEGQRNEPKEFTSLFV